MGAMVIDEAERASFTVTARLDRGSGSELPGQTEVVIDFSSPSAWDDLDLVLRGRSAALVSGTTGLDRKERDLLARWSSERPVFHSPNMSVGVFVMGRLVAEARRMLGEGFDLELIEIHHRNKADSPSGTALSLLEGISGNRVYGRRGLAGPRPVNEIGVHSLRGGDVPGEHQVHLMGDGERLCITHTATGRRVFALGALRAAEFVAGRPPGLYGMEDMLAENP